jgi:hypothetical protein
MSVSLVARRHEIAPSEGYGDQFRWSKMSAARIVTCGEPHQLPSSEQPGLPGNPMVTERGVSAPSRARRGFLACRTAALR